MNLIESLIMDHDAIRALMRPLRSKHASSCEKKASFKHLSDLVRAHSSAEEIAVYIPSKNKGAELRDLAMEGYEEHALIEALIKKMSETPQGDQWQSHALILYELLEHHLVEEEEEHFRQILDIFSPQEIERAALLYFDQRGFHPDVSSSEWESTLQGTL